MRWYDTLASRVARGVKDRPFVTAMFAALVLLSVPTAATLFAGGDYTWPFWLRSLLMSIWVLIAAGAAWTSAARDRTIDRLAGAAVIRRLRRQEIAWSYVLRGLVKDGEWAIPERYELTLYVYDEDENRLVPQYPPWSGPGEDPRIFDVGKGATGTAWMLRKTVIVRDQAVSNAKYGLTALQQDAFRDYALVISEPVFGLGAGLDDNPAALPIGTLTLLASKDDGHFTAAEDRLAVIRQLADALGVLLSVVPSETVGTND